MIRVGDLVNDPNERRLYCGSGYYSRAIVVSLKPFIMVSESSDMLWTQQKPEGFVKVGRAGLLTRFRCLRRLTWKQRVRFLTAR